MAQSDRPGVKRREGIAAGLHLQMYPWYLYMEGRGWLVRERVVVRWSTQPVNPVATVPLHVVALSTVS